MRRAQNKSVLVIDDSPTVRRLAELVLSQHDYTVYTAEDGDEGLERARQVLPSVILVDFVMPKMNGYKFCRLIRTEDSLKDIPLILISSKGEDVGQTFEERFGVLHYFQKPFEPEELIEKLEEVLAERGGEEDQEEILEAEVAAGGMVADLVGVEDRLDKLVRRYFEKDFRLLMKQVIGDTLRETGLVKSDTLALSGRIGGDLALPDLLQFIHLSRLSGRLSIVSRAVFGEVFVEEGMVVFATLSKKGFHQFLTDLIQEDRNIDPVQIREAVEDARDRCVPIGRVLVERAVLSKDELMNYLRRLTEEAFHQILEADSGSFFLERTDLPVNLRDITFRLPMTSIMLDGLRRLDEKKVAAAHFTDDKVVLIRLITNEDALASVDLDERELEVFSLIDGSRELREIIETSKLDDLEVKRICYSLQKIGLLKTKQTVGRV